MPWLLGSAVIHNRTSRNCRLLGKLIYLLRRRASTLRSTRPAVCVKPRRAVLTFDTSSQDWSTGQQCCILVRQGVATKKDQPLSRTTRPCNGLQRINHFLAASSPSTEVGSPPAAPSTSSSKPIRARNTRCRGIFARTDHTCTTAPSHSAP